MTSANIVCTYLLSRDLDVSRRFYTALCGYQAVEQGEWFVVLARGPESQTQLGLIDWVSQFVPRAARGEAQGGFLEIVVDDVAAALDAVAGFSVEITEAPEPDDPTARAVLRDPDGHVIALTTIRGRFSQPPQKSAA